MLPNFELTSYSLVVLYVNLGGFLQCFKKIRKWFNKSD